jgi:hypothetical protein
MENSNINDLSEKLLQGMKKALKKLVETNAANNKDLVVKGKDGKPERIPAKELMHKVN